MKVLENGFESVMTVIVLPEKLRKSHHTYNHIERLNRELKRRSNVIRVFPNSASILRIMGSVLMEWHDTRVSLNKIYSAKLLEEVDQNLYLLKNIVLEQQKL